MLTLRDTTRYWHTLKAASCRLRITCWVAMRSRKVLTDSWLRVSAPVKAARLLSSH